MEQIRAFTNWGWQLLLLFTRFYTSQVVQEFFYPQYQSPWYNLHMWQWREATNWPHSMSYHNLAFHTTQLEHIYIYIYILYIAAFVWGLMRCIEPNWRLFSRSQTLESSQGIGQVHVTRRFKAPGRLRRWEGRLPQETIKKRTPQHFRVSPPNPKDSWGF